MKVINVVTNTKVISLIKFSKYFKQSLGFASTVESKGGDRVLSSKDNFAISYNYQYKTTIHKQGTIGNIDFYVDYYINEPIMAFYYNLEEFIKPFDDKLFKENNIDFIIGKSLREVEEDYKKLIDDRKNIKNDASKKEINLDSLTKNPGSVSYDTIKEYIKNKNLNRI